MARFAVIDMNNLVNRAVHVVKNTPDEREWIGRTYMIVFQSIAKMANKFAAQHCVACFDSYSWREEIYNTYKENRKHDTTPKKIQTKRISHIILREFVEYLRNKTNITVLEAPRMEADDFIARFVQRHQAMLDSHVIISNDADFKQLVGPGIDLYDPIPGVLYTSDGVYFQDDRKDPNHPTARRYWEVWKIRYSQPKTTVVYRYEWDEGYKGHKGSFVYPISAYPNGDGFLVRDLTKTDRAIRIIRIVGEQRGWEYYFGIWLRFPVLAERYPLTLQPDDRIRFIQPRETFNPRWELFLKCIRGDARDNIRPSFPRVPETRLRKAFGDKAEYVKLINDYFGSGEHRQPVKPLFDMNKRLIDLTAQPTEIVTEMDRVIDVATEMPAKQMVELYFDQFCDQYGIRKLKEVKQNILPIISKPYPRQLHFSIDDESATRVHG
jgi:hypothetical protein